MNNPERPPVTGSDAQRPETPTTAKDRQRHSATGNDYMETRLNGFNLVSADVGAGYWQELPTPSLETSMANTFLCHTDVIKLFTVHTHCRNFHPWVTVDQAEGLCHRIT